MQDNDHIIVFQKYDTTIEANLAKSKLDAYGIPCFLTGENMANLYPGASNLMNFNVRLHLFLRDLEKARQVMLENNLRVSDESYTRCPRCGSTNIGRDFPKNMTSGFTSALHFLFFGIFHPGKKVFLCADCEHEFEDD
jgi:DNA-directed RNA polymerase subunit RPC12/RpoP